MLWPTLTRTMLWTHRGACINEKEEGLKQRKQVRRENKGVKIKETDWSGYIILPR